MYEVLSAHAQGKTLQREWDMRNGMPEVARNEGSIIEWFTDIFNIVQIVFLGNVTTYCKFPGHRLNFPIIMQ